MTNSLWWGPLFHISRGQIHLTCSIFPHSWYIWSNVAGSSLLNSLLMVDRPRWVDMLSIALASSNAFFKVTGHLLPIFSHNTGFLRVDKIIYQLKLESRIGSGETTSANVSVLDNNQSRFSASFCSTAVSARIISVGQTRVRSADCNSTQEICQFSFNSGITKSEALPSV